MIVCLIKVTKVLIEKIKLPNDIVSIQVNNFRDSGHVSICYAIMTVFKFIAV